MSKNKKLNVKANVDQIKVGPFKAVKYYEAQIEGPDKWLKTFSDIGRKVITEDQYLNIGFNHVIKNAVDNEFELDTLRKSLKKPLKKYKKKK